MMAQIIYLAQLQGTLLAKKREKLRVKLDLLKQIERDSKNYYNAVSKLEDEIMTQRNVVKALNDDNVRLRKKLKSKDNEYQS